MTDRLPPLGHVDEQKGLPPTKWRRCPLFHGVCDQGVLIGECPNRASCTKLRRVEDAEGTLLGILRRQ